MLNELGQEYIVAARAKGLSETRIIWRHALRNAMVPLVTVIALSYAGLLEGSVLTETVFAWPGLGLYITNSLQNADMNAVLGGTIIVGSIFIGLNLLSDLLYRMLDPQDARPMSETGAREDLHAWLVSDRPRSRRQALRDPRLRRMADVRCEPPRGGRPADRRGARARRALRRPPRAVLAVRRRPARDAAPSAVGRALVRHRRPGPRHRSRA